MSISNGWTQWLEDTLESCPLLYVERSVDKQNVKGVW